MSTSKKEASLQSCLVVCVCSHLHPPSHRGQPNTYSMCTRKTSLLTFARLRPSGQPAIRHVLRRRLLPLRQLHRSLFLTLVCPRWAFPPNVAFSIRQDTQRKPCSLNFLLPTLALDFVSCIAVFPHDPAPSYLQLRVSLLLNK